jgi:hypothetical protein
MLQLPVPVHTEEEEEELRLSEISLQCRVSTFEVISSDIAFQNDDTILGRRQDT